MNKKFGIYDVEDNCWIGNDNSPLTYDDEMLAKVAVTIVTARMRYTGGKLQARIYDTSPKRFKDRIEPKMSGEEAIKHIEEGGI